MRRLWNVGVLASLIIAACAGSTPGPPRTAAPGEILATLDGVSLSVRIDPNPVPRGEDVTFTATVRNDRSSAVNYESGGCAFADLSMSFPVPWEPTGRSWTDQEGWFKDFLLNHAYGPGALSPRTPPDEVLSSTPCQEGIPLESILQPRDELKADFTMAVRSALLRNPHVASVPFSITFNLDRQNDPPPMEPGFTGVPPRYFPIYRQIAAEGVLTIGGRPSKLLTAGEAIDRLLDDDEFASWVTEQPPGTCESANLELDSLAGNGDAPGWFINLWCETGVPRHRGGAWVNAETGEIKKLEMCGDPCS